MKWSTVMISGFARSQLTISQLTRLGRWSICFLFFCSSKLADLFFSIWKPGLCWWAGFFFPIVFFYGLIFILWVFLFVLTWLTYLAVVHFLSFFFQTKRRLLFINYNCNNLMAYRSINTFIKYRPIYNWTNFHHLIRSVCRAMESISILQKLECVIVQRIEWLPYAHKLMPFRCSGQQ